MTGLMNEQTSSSMDRLNKDKEKQDTG